MKTFRTTVFQRAYNLMKTTGKAFAVCLSKAWQLYRLAKKMRTEAVEFTFEKADGTLRKAIGTLKDVAQFVKGTGNPATEKVFHYWDLEQVAFRCFKIENLISIKY